MADTALHIPRTRRPVLTRGQIWLLLAIGCLGVWYGMYRLLRWAIS